MRITFGFLLSLLLLCSIAGVSQSANPCGLIAKISPGADTIVADTDVLHFTSQSLNATGYKFIENGYSYTMNTPLSRRFSVGLNNIKLVAYNGSCTDTAVVYVLQPGKHPADRTNLEAFYGLNELYHTSTGFDVAPSGGYIMSGYVEDYTVTRFRARGVLIRTKEPGCVEWSRFLMANEYQGGRITAVKAVADGGFAGLAIDIGSTGCMFKTDANGNLLWSKIYTTSTGQLYPETLQITDDGGYILSGGMPGFYGGGIILKLDGNGNVVWARFLRYVNPAASLLTSIAQSGNDVFVGGRISWEPAPQTYAYPSVVIKLNYATGAVEWTKSYQLNGGDVRVTDLRILPGNELLVNTAGNNSTDLNAFFMTDFSGSVKRARQLSYQLKWPVSHSTIVPLANGQFYVLTTGTMPLTLQPYFSHHSLIMKLKSDLSVQWARDHFARGYDRLFFAGAGAGESFVGVGQQHGPGVQIFSGSQRIMFRRLDSSGSDRLTNCYMYEPVVASNPVNIISNNLVWSTDSSGTFGSTSSGIRLEEAYIQARYTCPEFIDSCTFVKLNGPKSICNLNNTYTYRVHKFNSCGQRVQWSTRGSVQIVQQTDTSLTVKFATFGDHSIKAVLPYACSPIADSISIVAASKTPPLNLGRDTAICPGNSFVLKAGPKFFSYLWQDGSTDSVRTISAPGIYWIKVMDSCSNILVDTITVTQSASISFYAGPDRIKCNNDTLQLSAPPGYTNYSWSPGYNISAQNRQHVTVNPTIDTSYLVSAEKTPGCFAYDTIRVKVNISASLDLGNDTSFCSGDSIVLNAGNQFATYQWSSGNTSQQIQVKAAGKYSVIGISTNGCKSYDTFQVIKVFANPTVQLDATSFLCAGTSKTLDAGTFASYLWQNGTTNRTLAVNTTGTYAVTVTDNNHCKGSDTVILTTIHSSPHDFLPADTLICTYGKLQLIPAASFKSYTWSTNEVSAAIYISKPGRYWLQVSDQFGCVGKDSITIKSKDCLSGFYVPNAFTPGNNGKNDIFKPMLFGIILKYHFTVYNRWGQKIFETKDINKGWTGNYTQSSNQYVWTCTYQLEGEPVKTEKGTVMVMR